MDTAMFDLFGDTPVLFSDLEIWIDIVGRIPRGETIRRQHYRNNWNLPAKIKAAKNSGLWSEILDQYEAQQRLITGFSQNIQLC